MACGCSDKQITVQTVEDAQAAADARRQAQSDLIRREKSSQNNAQANAGAMQ
jgi:hypothetical protein